MGFDPHKSIVELDVKWGTGVITNECAECSICSNRTTTTEPIAEKASPADSLTRSCEPFVDGSSA